jgi:hypothetical protein
MTELYEIVITHISTLPKYQKLAALFLFTCLAVWQWFTFGHSVGRALLNLTY